MATQTSTQCLDDDTVLGFLDGGLTEEERAAVDVHVDTCPACLALVAALGRAHPGEAASELERYEIRGEVGAGGMGQVFEAYDVVLGRVVALKCVRSGPEDELAARRFEREMVLTARLQHPSIIPVYDAGLFPDGSRYFAMRLVEGEALSAAIAADATLGARLTLVPSVRGACEAVAYAHERSVIHRDLKPANILIGPFGETVVLDWGLAKDLDERDDEGEQTLVDAPVGMTRAGAVMGTAGYIAPELTRGEPAGTRSDVFSLGKVLAALISDVDPADTNAELLADLGAIVERATATDPASRYPDASALCEDLRRFEAGQTVSARDYSTRARLTRFARRYRRGILLSFSLVSAGAIVGVGTAALVGDDGPKPCSGAEAALEGIWDDAQRTRVRTAFAAVDEPYAERAEASTEQRLDEFAKQWISTHTDACESAARGEQSSKILDLRMTCLDRATTRLTATVDILTDADTDVVRNANSIVRDLPRLERCTELEALATAVDPPPDAESEAVGVAQTEVARIDALRLAGRYDEALLALQSARDALEGTEYKPIRTELALAAGLLYDRTDELHTAVDELDDAIRLGVQTGQWDEVRLAALTAMVIVGDGLLKPAQAIRYRPLAEGLSVGNPRNEVSFQMDLGAVFFSSGEYTRGEEVLRAAIVNAVELDDPVVLSLARRTLALGLLAQQKHSEAESLLRDVLADRLGALGPDHPSVLSLRVSLSESLSSQGRNADAEAEIRGTLVLMERVLPPTHHEFAEARTILGFALYYQGEHAEAEAQFRRAIEIFEISRGTEDPSYALAHYSLGFPLVTQGKLAEAEEAFRTAIDGATASLGANHPTVISARSGLAEALREGGKLAEAEAEFRTAIASSLESHGPDSPAVAVVRGSLAEVLFRREKLVEAEAEYRGTLEILEAQPGSEHPFVPRQRASLARLLLETERASLALPLAEQAWTQHEKDGNPPEERARTAFILAQIVAALGQPRERARSLAEDARASYARAGDVHDESRREVEAWLERTATE